MGNIFQKIWRNFKAQPDLWFFYGFLITFTFSIRKVLFFYPINGQFNEYSGIYLYLSDIFLILTFVLWVIYILKHKYSNSSSNISQMFHMEHFTKPIILIPLILTVWSFISIGWTDYKNIALFRSIKLLEFYLLYVYIVFICSTCLPAGRRGTILRRIFQIIIFIGLFQAIIGIWQFIIQKSIGLFWLKESLLSPEILGVAKIILGGEKFIRSYGLFPHPNILGGFLLFSIISTFLYFKLLKIPPSPPFKKGDALNVPHGTFQLLSPFHKGRVGEGFLWITLFIQFIALLMTFSKSAILGLMIALVYIMFHACLPAGRWNNLVFFWVEHKKKIILIIAILVLLVIIIKPNINSLFFKSLNERVIYMEASPIARCFTLARPQFVPRGTNEGGWNNCKTLVYGLGSGQFVLNMNKFVPRGTNLEFWQYQPVHNVLLLIWSELGIIGLLLFIWWIWKLFHPRRNEIVPHGTISSYGAGVEQNTDPKDVSRLSRETRMFPVEHSTFHWDGTLIINQQFLKILKGLLLGFIFIMLFDHYFWDIQQGQIMLWLLAGLIIGIANYDILDPVRSSSINDIL